MTSTLSANYTNFESFESKKLDVFIQLGKDLDEDVLSEMLSTYFQTTEETVDQFKSNFVAKDFKTIAHLAHKLKSSSGQLGLHKLHKLCTDLENFVDKNQGADAQSMVNDYLNFIFDEIHLTTALLTDFLKVA